MNILITTTALTRSMPSICFLCSFGGDYLQWYWRGDWNINIDDSKNNNSNKKAHTELYDATQE